jgi:phage tail sheath gpL-like
MTLASVIDSSYKVPGSFVAISLGAGARSPGTGAMKVLLVGNKATAGTGNVNQVYEVAGKDDVKLLAGQGSELHRMAIAIFKANPIASVSIVIVTAAGTAATKTFTVAGTTASADGAVEVWIAGERVIAPISIGDTPTLAAAAIAAAINARPDLPVTATSAIGVVTATARCAGIRGNRISSRSLLTGGTGLTHTAATGFFTTGATMDDPQLALDAAFPLRWHLVVAPYTTTTELQKFRSMLNTGALPINGKRGRFIACSPDTLAASITVSDAVNASRGEIAWLEDCDDLPGEVAAALAGAITAERSSDRAANLDDVAILGLKPQPALDDVPTAAEQNSALNNGLTPLITVNGEIRIVRSVTNYHLDGTGADDFSILDSHKVDVADFIGDVIEQNFATRYKGFKISAHPTDGTAPPAKVATPVTVRDFLYIQLVSAEEQALLEGVEALKSQLVVELDVNTAGRMNADIPINVIDHFHQLGANVAQVG